MEVEVYRPYFPLAGIFSGGDVDSDVDIARVFCPTWYLSFTNATYARRRRSGIGVYSGVIGANNVDVK
jgi:hypothetical protein